MDKPKGSLISYFANKVKSEGGINLAQGIPAYDPPKELMNHLQKVALTSVHQYAPGVGNHQLLNYLADTYKSGKENFLIVNGATEAISLLFLYLKEIINEPFTVMGFDPVYETYKNLPRIFNVPFRAFKMNPDNSLDFAKLEIEMVESQVKIVMLSTPGNPLGKVWTKAEMNTLVDICKKNEVYLIIDAVYADLYFEEKTYYPTENIASHVFYVNSFSKKFSVTGWRIGYLMAHLSHMDKIMDMHDYTGLCAPSVLQQALADFLDSGNQADLYIHTLRNRLKENYKQLAKAFEKLGFKVAAAQGGYFVWAELPKNFTSGLEFALKLYETKKVAVVPGVHFSEYAEAYIRINIARYPEEILLAIEKVTEFCSEYS